MAAPYIYERQSEYWTSRQVEEFFIDSGFDLLTFPLTQRSENRVPTDFIFFDKKTTKLFAFQYKALYQNQRDFWQIDDEQHKNLSAYPWIYYCLSELRYSRDYRAALHLARIAQVDFPYQEKIFPDGEGRLNFYYRWGAFYQGLQKCTTGVLVSSKAEFLNLLNPRGDLQLTRELSTMLVDVFLADFDSRHAVRFSPQIREIDQ